MINNEEYREVAERRRDLCNAEEGKLNEIDGYNCDKCKNKGFIWKLDENLFDVRSDCECTIIRDSLRRARNSGLGNILSDYSFEKYIAKENWQEELKKKAQQFCTDDSAKWFFIGGQVGCGKTHLCTAISAHYINSGYELRYMVWVEDSKRIKAVANEPSYQTEINKFKKADVLYIDDFLKVRGGEQPTSADINLAFEILNHRLMNPEQITIISSEKTLDEIAEYDEATMSRIFQLTGEYKFNIGKKKKKNYRTNP